MEFSGAQSPHAVPTDQLPSGHIGIYGPGCLESSYAEANGPSQCPGPCTHSPCARVRQGSHCRLAKPVRGQLGAPSGLEDIKVEGSSWHRRCHPELHGERERQERPPERWRVCVLLPQDQRPHLTPEYRGRDTAPPCKLPVPLDTFQREGRECGAMGAGKRKNRKRFVFKGAITETQSVFPSPAESKEFSLLGEWLTLFSWLEGCFQEPPQSSPSHLQCSS